MLLFQLLFYKKFSLKAWQNARNWYHYQRTNGRCSYFLCDKYETPGIVDI